MSAKLAMSVLGLCGFCASAAIVGVSDSHRITVASGDTVSPQTTAVCDTLPDVGSQPIFHLDASRTNGWTFGANGTSVRRLPSLVGARYLLSRTGSYIHDLSKRDPANGVWDGNDYKAEFIDRNTGCANAMHFVNSQGQDVIVGANREIDEVALYTITE